MASNQDIGDELKCPICKDYFKVPKVMGTCLHAACLECLQQLVALSGTDFPCPVCREKCKIPTQGVAALKDDYKIRAIVEKYQQLKKEKNFIHCSACPNPASHFCKDCENIYLCIACSGKHSRNPLTNTHELVGVCSKHGKSLAMYCRKCNAAICSVCLIADHASCSQDHDVVSHQKVADEEVAEVASAVDQLEKTMGQKEYALRNIIRIRDNEVATIDSDLSLLGKRSDSVIEKSNKACVDLKAESSCLQEQIEALIKKKKAVDDTYDATKKKITSDRQKSKQYSDFLNRYRIACMEKFEEAVTQTVAETDEIKANVEISRKEWSTKQVLNDQTVPTLLKIKEGLRQTLTTAEQVDRAAQFVDAEERMPRFVAASDHTEIGFIRREHALKKFADISFPAHRACKSVGSLKHLPDGRLACLYQTEDYQHTRSLGDTMMLYDHNSAFPAASLVVLDKTILTAVAMTVTSKGEPMLLDNCEFVRVFNNDGDRDINLDYCLTVSSIHTSFECDDEDNMFVGMRDMSDLSHSLNGSFCVFNPDGILITKISQRGVPDVKMMSYCRLRRIVYLLVPDNVILRYHWDGTTVTKMQSLRLPRVHGFKCDDICIDNLGAVLVAGHDSDGEVHIYQVLPSGSPIRLTEDAASSTHGEELDDSDDESSEDEGIKCTMIELNFEDNVRRLVNRKRKGPVISISGDTLALGYNKQIELFHLLL